MNFNNVFGHLFVFFNILFKLVGEVSGNLVEFGAKCDRKGLLSIVSQSSLTIVTFERHEVKRNYDFTFDVLCHRNEVLMNVLAQVGLCGNY